MAHIVIGAQSLRPGGGLQVIRGLAARFSSANDYTILVTDPASRELLGREIGPRPNIAYVDPIGRTDALSVFRWSMTRQAGWLKQHRADGLLGVNHFFPAGPVPQIVYHMNVLRFARPKRPLWASGEPADRLRDWCAVRALKQADANIFESKLLFEIAQSRRSAIRNPQIVYIGVDETKAGPRAQVAAPEPAILALTSPQPHKDNPTLVRMLAELVRKRPDVPWRLQIAGGRTPEVFADLVALAGELGVADRLDLLGFRTHAELAEIGARSLCLVSTSRVESFCMVGLEAMSWGCPVVVADISAMPESVADAGLLARPGDAADFADRAIEIWATPGLRDRLVAKGLERAGSLTWSNAARQVEDIMDAAMVAKSHSRWPFSN